MTRRRLLLPCAALACSLAASAQPVPNLHLVIPFENVKNEARIHWLSEASAVLLTDNLVTLGAPAIRREERSIKRRSKKAPR